MGQTFYLIRHGETDWNASRRLQGHSDIPLNEKGQSQARQLRHSFQNISIDLVYASDLSRARQTAELGFAKSPMTHHHLREVFLGKCEGLTREEIRELHGNEFWEEWTSHKNDFLDHRLQGGESKREMLKRVTETLEVILRAHHPKTIAIVTHGLVMGTLTHFLRPDLEERLLISNCGIVQLERQGPGQLRWVSYFEPGTLIELGS